jgi:hypothetical protein
VAKSEKGTMKETTDRDNKQDSRHQQQTESFPHQLSAPAEHKPSGRSCEGLLGLRGAFYRWLGVGKDGE